MGVTIEIAAADEDTRSRLARQWSRAAVGAPSDEAVDIVHAPSGAAESKDAGDYALTTQVTLAALRATAGERYNLHAGGLADDDGRVLAVVAPSGTGKTTATRLLAERLGYVSDETISITPDGRVHPHAKPLSLVTDPEHPGRKEQRSPDELGLRPTPVTARLGRFVVLRRGVPDPRGLVRLDTMEALLNLIEQSSSVSQATDPLVTLLSLVQSVGGVWALEYDEISEHLDELEALLARDLTAEAVPSLKRHPGGPKMDRRGSVDTLVRLPWVDAIELDDEVLVLQAMRAVRLDHLMATTWLELTSPRTLDELLALVQSRHGEHPDARELVEKAVDLLVEEELLAWRTLA
jgi:hypothetical protein